MIKNFFVLTVCGLLVYGLTIWLEDAERQFSLTLTPHQMRQQIVHRFNHLHTVQFDENGLQKFEITATTVEFQPEQQKSTLQSPLITVTKTDRPRIQVKGNYGYIDHAANQLTLQQNVQMDTDPTRAAAAKLDTDHLLIDLKGEVATTGQPVTITRNNTIMHAVGMKLNFKDQQINLLSSVRGQHVN